MDVQSYDLGQFDTSKTADAAAAEASSSSPACSKCPGYAHSDATCANDKCGYTCQAGYLDCDQIAETGCEVEAKSTPEHCGTCDHSCPVPDNSLAQCVDGKCGSTCQIGFSDCIDGKPGCETNVDTDVFHCGDCKTVCAGATHASPVCNLGACALQCNKGWGNCDNNPANGCETDTSSDANNCGGCGLQCKAGVACIGSSCACASTSQAATLIPVDMYIMMDQSGSMKEATGTKVTKWKAIASAFDAFLVDPKSVGMGVGIQYFPLSTGGIFGMESCTPSDYASPEVPIGVLPGNAAAITSSIKAHGPSGDTPTGAALQGAIQYATVYQKNHPDHAVVAVLATDGEPNSMCSNDSLSVISGYAKAAAGGNPKILTFVIGVGSSLASLNAIAAAGGTGQAFLVDTNGNVVTQFQAALQAIQGKAIGCAYAIPKPPAGQSLDFTKVNVQVTLSKAVPKIIGYVDDASKCNASTGGWYFDNAAAPSKILLCPETCGGVTVDTGAKVDVLLGCSRESGD